MKPEERIEKAMPLLLMALATGHWDLVKEATDILNGDSYA